MATHPRVGRSRAAGGGESRTARDALDRARVHLRTAIAEGIEAARELLEAASLATNGSPSEAHPALRRITTSLDELAARLAGDADLVPPLLASALIDALDEEIARWEIRSETDPEARPVLRAFLGMREILWEFGLRKDPAHAGPRSGPRKDPAHAPPRAEPAPGAPARAASKQKTEQSESAPPRRARVQRVEVQG